MGPPPENHPTDKLTFLRGVQLTGSDGTVVFKTIFPGFYEGRRNHIHFKVRDGIGGSGNPIWRDIPHTSARFSFLKR
jgi:protocatechuate 3,4-dioxygenase beta subunit